MSLPIAITLETLSLLVFYCHLIGTLCNACQIIPTIWVNLHYSRKDICSCRINAKYWNSNYIGCLQFLVPSNARCMAWFTHSCRSLHHCHIHGNCGVSFWFCLTTGHCDNFNKLIKKPLKPFTSLHILFKFGKYCAEDSLSIEWNSIRLRGPPHGILTINCTQNSTRSVWGVS